MTIILQYYNWFSGEEITKEEYDQIMKEFEK
jgi:hypothetical protein